MAINPRWKTGRRKRYQQRFKAMGLPCAICGKPIDYSLPYYSIDEQGRKHVNMWAFVIDEIQPISKWQQAGYNSEADAANTWQNLQPAHAICNAMKGNKTNFTLKEDRQGQGADVPKIKNKKIISDGNW